MASQDGGSMTGLTSGEAREFHRIFMKSTIAFIGYAFFMHVMVHFWRPWLYYDGSDTVTGSLQTLLPFVG